MKKIFVAAIFSALILAAFLVIPGAIAATEYPILPSAYYGNVTVNGGPAAAGTTIVARIDGTERGRINTITSGVYGSSEGSGEKLVVNGERTENGSTTVYFYVEGVAANQTTTWVANEVKQIDLIFALVPIPYGVNLTSDSYARSTTPGVNASYMLNVTNTGNSTDTINLTLTNPNNASIAALNASNVSLNASASRRVRLEVTNTSAGTFVVNVTAVSQGNNSISASVSIITTVSAVPTATGVGSSSGGTGGGGVVYGEPTSNVEARESHDLEIYKDRLTSYMFTKVAPIMFVNITGNVNAGLITTAVEILKNTSSLVKMPPPGLVYKNINIWVGTNNFATPKNIKDAAIEFEVDNGWIRNNGIADSDIRMVRWDGNDWIELETNVLSKDDVNTYFEAKTDSFSPFAIIAKVAVPTATVTGPAPTLTPGITGTPLITATPVGPPVVVPSWLIGLIIIVLIGVAVYFLVIKKGRKEGE